jgi:hypothetical protein
MYEKHITNWPNNGHPPVDNIQVETDGTVTVWFVVTTQSRGSVKITKNGNLSQYFGGLGVTESELQKYRRKAVQIWASITGNNPAKVLREVGLQQI